MQSQSGEETGVPYVDSGGARIWYTTQGTGFPMLTLAPGGMRSSVPLWELAAINPLTAYAGQYQMIAMDQRNAGQSAGPLETGDPWGAYAADQLAVMDHLGIGRFLVFGCCIGGPFTLKLLALAPERVVAAVLEQPAGITASNRELFGEVWRQWRDQLLSERDDLAGDQIEAFATAMWARDFAVSVTRDQVRSFRTPMLVLPGVDEYHPAQTGREIAALAPAAELLEPWKDPEHLPAATEAVGRFLQDHTPR
jgi:pimeloyl-ACP methyl ester carboxylesterase